MHDVIPGRRWHELILNLEDWKHGADRPVERPLLLLLMLAKAQAGEPRRVAYADIEGALALALRELGPPRKRVRPERAFWELHREGILVIDDPKVLGTGGRPPSRTLLRKRKITAAVPLGLWRELIGPGHAPAVVAQALLDAFWPAPLHEDVVRTVGLDMALSVSPRQVDPRFRYLVLRAYEQRCAVCGYDGRLDGALLGVDAVYIRFRQDGGPDVVPNGLALCPLHRKLFLRGVLGLDERLRITVSARLEGGCVDETVACYHGREMTGPQTGAQFPNPAFVRWHTRHVFRGPPMDGSG